MIARALILGLLLSTGAARAAPTTEHWRVQGLEGPAQIVVDRWGVPHIFAADERDAFFLQGYNAARDRLWQIDLWRKRGLGLLSASFGAAYVEEDRAARLLLYRGDMAAEWASYAPGAKAIVEAFTGGINAYVAETREGTKPLPVEFSLTASRPDFWRPEDVVRIRSHALVGNLTSEVARAQVACAAGLPADALRRKLEPPHTPIVPQGLDPCVVTPEVLKDYILGVQPVGFTAASGKVAAIGPARFTDAMAGEGSNNWVVAASRTITGRPILANDPHRLLGVPSLRYIVHLNAPGLDLIGAGEPALPGVVLGHNAAAAFGLTIFAIDQEDLYVYALDPADPNRYRYGPGWETMRLVQEAIEVKGEAPREVVLRFTRHGPVIDWDPAHGRAFALRTVWGAPGASGYFQATWLTHAKSWNDFLAAHDHWGAPPLNLVFANSAGDVGWAASGLTPVRPNWDGLLPVPGDGRYEWRGFLEGEDLPVSRDPAKGWFATANEMNLPDGYPDEARKVSFEWADRSRIDRIEAVLGANSQVSLADSTALQTDATSTISRRLTSLIAPLSSPNPRLAQALALLKVWDHVERTDSAAAAIYEVWAVKHLGPAVVRQAEPRAAKVIGLGNLDASLTWLEHAEGVRDEILLASLGEALDELTARLGPDMASWTWGRLHHAIFTPAVAPLADPALRAAMTVGPAPLPGGASTPKAATWAPADFNTISGASVRMVVDVGAWDNSLIINTPGQSGDPQSPHYRDLFPLWATGRYIPMLFSRPAIDAAAERVIELTPSS
ncbi:MAG TPA: penicillin acylase family protein [Caulobacteraceae bacterium]